MSKKHIITFDQFGGLSVDATGYKGKACEAVTEKLLEGLKTATVSDDKKPEYYETEFGKANDVVSSRW